MDVMVVDGDEFPKKLVTTSHKEKQGAELLYPEERQGKTKDSNNEEGQGKTKDLNEERQGKIKDLNDELVSLFRFFKEAAELRHEALESQSPISAASNANATIASMLEEKVASYSKLAAEIFQSLKDKHSGLTIACVKSSVLLVGQRVSYGVPNAEADVLEDESESCLWCWEAKDMKLLPKSIRGYLKIRRTWRKKISERITAILGVLSLLHKPDESQSYRSDIRRASEKLNKTLNEADIRLLVQSLVQRSGSNIADKEVKREEKLLIKQMEKNKRDIEKEKKRMERELHKEKLQREKEQKKLLEEAERDEKRREKEELEMRRQKRKRDEIDRDQLRREKEEAKQKKQLSLQKQVSIMERFLKKNKNNCSSERDCPPTDASASNVPGSNKVKSYSVTVIMDAALMQRDVTDLEDIQKSHLDSWRRLGKSIRSGSTKHWGVRLKPKTSAIKELKLSCLKETLRDEEWGVESLGDGWGEATEDGKCCGASSGSALLKHVRKRQLLQFDKSYRPAFYGIWPKKSLIIGPRHPFKKDPELDYDVDSDEEWEEEEPGESLSDCDKGDEEALEEGSLKADDEDESEDGFFVPDGYLSENEGVQSDRSPSHREEEDATGLSTSCKQEPESKEHSAWLQQLKYLHNVTEHALRRNQPLIITNLMHEKSQIMSVEDLSGTPKLEHMCLQALSMGAFPGGSIVEAPSDKLQEDDQEANFSNNKNNSLDGTAMGIPDSDLPRIVSIIHSYSHGINKLIESLQQQFPNVPKAQLRNKVREISDFVDNRWQVKKAILLKLGMSTSPEKSVLRAKSIAAFFSKRCLPPSEQRVNPTETSPESSQKMSGSRQSHQQQDIHMH